MKILMLGWELPPHHSGGLGVVCYQMCKQLAKSGADIEFVLPYHSKFEEVDFMKITSGAPLSVESVLYQNGVYDSLHFDNHLEKHEFIQGHYEETAARLATLGEYDVIHSHDWLTVRAAIAAKKASGMPLFMHVHSTEYDRSAGGYGNPYVREIEYNGMMIADKVIAISQYVKDVLVREYSIPEEKIEVVHNRIDMDLFANEGFTGSNEYKILNDLRDQGFKVVTMISRLTIQKNLVNSVSAVAKAISQNPKVLLLLVGSGEQREELIEHAADLGIAQNVFFVPFQHGKQLADAYRVSDLFMLTSASEPFGITALEAIGYGAPVMVSKQAGVAEVISHSLKADFWDVDKMADMIVSATTNPGLLDELYENSRAEWEGMHWHGAAEKLMHGYRTHALGGMA